MNAPLASIILFVLSNILWCHLDKLKQFCLFHRESYDDPVSRFCLEEIKVHNGPFTQRHFGGRVHFGLGKQKPLDKLYIRDRCGNFKPFCEQADLA